MPERRNLGVIAVPEVPKDRWIAGAILVTIDEDGNYSFAFHSQSAEHLPAIEIREELGALAAHAWQVANCDGVAS